MKSLFISIKVLLIMTLLTGVVYTGLVTGVARLFFKRQANGSLVQQNGVIAGSELIGQSFDSTIYFQPRPSASGYDPMHSGGSNFSLSSHTLREQMQQRRLHFIMLNRLKDDTEVPPEMVFASGSGLDPDVSPAAVWLQVNRVVKARHFNERQKKELEKIIAESTEKPFLGMLGQERINILLLNLKLNRIQ